MYAPTHVNVWTGKSLRAVAAAAGLGLFRLIPGTEASLASWLATGRGRGLFGRARDRVRFLARKLRVFSVCVGADAVYYLRKPTGC
jgi:hypothetical protein